MNDRANTKKYPTTVMKGPISNQKINLTRIREGEGGACDVLIAERDLEKKTDSRMLIAMRVCPQNTKRSK